jgi:Tfp pilus assembly protein PilE
MITVAIIAILATIAMVIYRAQIRKLRRADARSAGAVFPVTVGSGYYQVSGTIGIPPVAYSITATAIVAQASDTKCAALNIDQFGSQSSTGTENAATGGGN